MDKTEKLALARKKLRKFQAKSTSLHLTEQLNEPTEQMSSLTPPLPMTKQVKLSTDLPSDKSTPILDNAHLQTIDVLVAEKTDLLGQLSDSRNHNADIQMECSHLQENVLHLKNQLEKKQREMDVLTHSSTEKTKLLTSQSHTVNLYEIQSKIEELEQEKTELLSKIDQQRTAIVSLEIKNNDLEKDLNMSKLISEQASSFNNTKDEKAEMLQREKATLSANIQSLKRERDQAKSDVIALRDTIMLNRQETAREVGQLQTQLKESHVHIKSLQQQLAAQYHHDVSQHEINEESLKAKDYALLVAQKELETLQKQVQQLTSNNQMLNQLQSDAEEKITSLDLQLKNAQDKVVDQQSFLSTVANDKETLSRVVAQNKELKNNLAELQDAFILRTNQNAELANSLESESRKKKKLEEKCTNLTERLTVENQRVLELMEQINILNCQFEDQVEKESVKNTQELYIQQENNHSTKSNEENSVTNQLDEHHLQNSQIQDLDIECTSLREERDRLLKELRHMSPFNTGADQSLQSVDLQKSFTALQEHFVIVMCDKAELEERLQESEHRIIQLEGETETIGEYISLYQTQREALKIKFMEKDRLIQQLLEDKAILELRLREVQGLAKQLDVCQENKVLTSLPSHIQTTFTSPPRQEQIVSMIQKLTSPLSAIDRHLQCPCCSGNLIVI